MKKILKRPSIYFFILLLILTIFMSDKLYLFDIFKRLYLQKDFIGIFSMFFVNYAPLLLSFLIVIIVNLNMQNGKKIILLGITITIFLFATFAVIFLLH